MKIYFAIPLLLSVFFIKCQSKPFPKFDKIPKELLFSKNGNMICGSQWLMLLSSEINSNMNNDVINKGDTIGQNSSKYSCTKAQNKSDICKVDIYSEIDEITTAVNLKLLAINEARKVLEEEYYKVKNTEYNTFHLSGLFEDNNKQDNLVNKIILQYKETKENAKAEIKRNNEFIKELKNKISLCNKNKN